MLNFEMINWTSTLIHAKWYCWRIVVEIERSNSGTALSFQTFVLVYKRRRALRVWLGIGSLSLGLIINSTITWIFYKEEEERWLGGTTDTWITELELCRLLEDAVFLISTTSRGCNPWQLPRNGFGNEKIDVELNILVIGHVLSFKAKGSPPDHDVNCPVHIAHISHNRHNRRWCTFFEVVYFLV